MYILSEQQVDYILNDIKVRGVEMEDLQLNLLDHVCCIVEYELEPGGNFEKFYQQIIPRFFKKELKEIEEETALLLTFKHYYAMKKTMNTVGIIASIGIVLGAIFRFQHWPGANVMLILGVVMISFVFLPLMFTLKLRESAEKRDRLVLIAGCVISILFVIAASFKLMHWPGANILMGASILLLLFGFVPVYLFTGMRNPVTKVNTLVNAILIIAGSGLLMSLSTNNRNTLPPSVVNGVAGIHERLLENLDKTKQQNKTLFQLVVTDSLPTDAKSYFSESESVSEYIDRLKVELIMLAENVDENAAKSLKVNQMSKVGNDIIGADFMIGPGRKGDSGHLKELQEKLASLQGKLSALPVAGKVGYSLNTAAEAADFNHVSLGFVLQRFAELQYEIANADKQVLTYYSAKL
ncbi:MAG: hypothetical protein WAQ28_16580 [Bacteroidia bacterium]